MQYTINTDSLSETIFLNHVVAILREDKELSEHINCIIDILKTIVSKLTNSRSFARNLQIEDIPSLVQLQFMIADLIIESGFSVEEVSEVIEDDEDSEIPDELKEHILNTLERQWQQNHENN